MTKNPLITADGLKYAHELLAKVEGIKSYVKNMRQVDQLNLNENVCLNELLIRLEKVARGIIKDREAEHERAGGVFYKGLPKVEYYVRR